MHQNYPAVVAPARRKFHPALFIALALTGIWLFTAPPWGIGGETASAKRTRHFQAKTESEARQWQEACREKLFALMMGGTKPARVPLAPLILGRSENDTKSYRLEEVNFQSLPDRRVHAWMAIPKSGPRKKAAILALHGHGGTGEMVVKGLSLYWYGRRLAEMGYVIISPDIGSHELQHQNWSLMGERVWDAVCTVDYLQTRPEVDPARLAVCGLSLGGETTMYMGAMDTRLRAVCSSGWLTTIENMKHGHCPCWNFPGLEDHFDFSDIFACIAPRPLTCEVGKLERAPGGFPVDIAQRAFAEIQPAYQIFSAEERLKLDVHDGGHVFVGRLFWDPLKNVLK